MNKIIREHYPAANLPEELRIGVDPSSRVTMTITLEEEAPEHTLTLDEMARFEPDRAGIASLIQQISE